MSDVDNERALSVADRLDIILAQQQQQATQLGKLIGQSGEHTARLSGFAEALRGLSADIASVREHTTNCPARTGYATLAKEVETLRTAAASHDREITEVRMRAKKQWTPPEGTIKLPTFSGPNAKIIKILIYLGIALGSAAAGILAGNQ
jgi:hypothetical protein